MARKVKKKKSGIRVFVIFSLIVVVFVFKFIITPGNQHRFETEYDDNTTLVPSAEIEPDSSVSISLDKLNSTNAILIRLEDQTILMQKSSEEKIYPASLTKMMTAIVAIENLTNLQKEIQLTHYTFNGLYSANASMAGFQPGEKVRAIDLLYGVMLRSGAELVGLMNHIAGSEQTVTMMIKRRQI